MDVKELVAKMTLEEKAGLCSGQDFWHTKAVERLQIPAMMVTGKGMSGRGSRGYFRTCGQY